MKKEVYDEIVAYLRLITNGTEYEYHVFTVGGCCRDYMMGREIKDVDLVVDTPNGGIEFAKWLHKKGYLTREPVVYEHFGTAMFHLKNFPDIELEAVQTRKESYRDIETRNPETAFGTIKDDCTRRDFTYNAIYHNITHGGLCDYNGNSFKDLNDNIIRTCGDPDVIFFEDPLRILRAVRFQARFGSVIEDETFDGMKRYVDRLSIISRERIHDEFMKICDTTHYDRMLDAFYTLWDIGAFKYIIPYMGNLGHKGVVKFVASLARFFGQDLFIPTKEGLFAAMMYNNPRAEEELRELKCTNDFVNEVMFLIKTNKEMEFKFNSGVDDDEEIYIILFRKYANICGDEKRLAQMIACGCNLDKIYFEYDDWDGTCLFTSLCNKEKMFFDYKLTVDGEDVMKELGIGPSKKVGEILTRLLNFVFINPDKHRRNDVIDFLKYIKTQGV